MIISYPEIFFLAIVLLMRPSQQQYFFCWQFTERIEEYTYDGREVFNGKNDLGCCG
jgi:hypothetical protein